jgi:hypothetical protein
MRFFRRFLAISVVAAAVLTARSAHAQGYGGGFDPFDQGRFRVSAFFGFLGAASGFNNTYFMAGVGIGYFVLPGLEVGAQIDEWFGSPPNVTRIAPELKYVFDIVDVVKPYIGGFYRRWFLSNDAANLNTAGGRAGLIIVSSPRTYVSAGAAYERVLGTCTAGCSFWFPEIGAALAF